MGTVAVRVASSDAPGFSAVRWAAQWAADHGESLQLVSMWETGHDASVDRALVRNGAAGAIDAARDLAVKTAPEVTVTTAIDGSHQTKFADLVAKNTSLMVFGSRVHGDHHADWVNAENIKLVGSIETPCVVVPDLDLAGRRGVAVGVDDSGTATKALNVAADEADRLGEPLIAVHVRFVSVSVGSEIGVTGSIVSLEEELRIANDTLEEVLAPVVGAHPRLEVRRVASVGDPVPVLTDAANEAKLLVVGTHGRGAIARLLLGSVSRGVLSNIAGPTLVVRP